MDEAYWEKLQSIFDGALAVEPAHQATYLAQACGDDEVLQQDVMSLLDAHVDASQSWSQAPLPSSLSASGFTGISALYTKGDQIGHHQIVEQIGAGGMGVVYQAFDSRLQRHVALKFLPAYLHTDEASRQRFMAEARAASRLDHPNICVIHDINETPEGHMYITMPHYEGETLAARLKRGRLPVDKALSVSIQVADGLTAAHAQDIVHRDIKPANIMLTTDGMVKILDFGIAKVADAHLTRTGMGIGTLAYMAPEQMHGQDVDARADIWALGVTLYEMLTGQTAFSGEGTSQLVDSVLNPNSDPADSLVSSVPPVLHGILSKAMQRNREARYAQMSLMLEEFVQLQAMLNAQQQGTRRTSLGSPSGKTAFEWDPAFLDEISEMLLPVLGPITTKLVHRQAKKANTVEALSASLSELLPDEARTAFCEKMKLRAAMHTTPPVPNQIKVSHPSTQLELTPVQLARLESCLLPHLGPIAGPMIRRALATTGEIDTVCELLTQSLTNKEEKTALVLEIKTIISE